LAARLVPTRKADHGTKNPTARHAFDLAQSRAAPVVCNPQIRDPDVPDADRRTVRAHAALDKAEDSAYGYRGGNSDVARMAFSFALYRRLDSLFIKNKAGASTRALKVDKPRMCSYPLAELSSLQTSPGHPRAFLCLGINALATRVAGDDE
jgi:hypothetical protein